jgi:deoxyribonuclease-4
MGKDALEIKANTFQFFTRNPRGSKAKEIDGEDVEGFLKLSEENNFTIIMGHAPYTMNACSADEKIRNFTLGMMKDDLLRMEYVPNNLYNFHPGSHVGQGKETGIKQIISLLNNILKPEQSTIVLLETMAGKGSEIGRNFEELKSILDGVTLKEKTGICFDTCHVYDSGYDIVNNLNGVIEDFDDVIGLDRLYAIHLNDSMNPMGSRKDRHSKIGEGTIGLEAIAGIINHPKLRHLPFFLETPNELDGYAREIRLLRELYKT